MPLLFFSFNGVSQAYDWSFADDCCIEVRVDTVGFEVTQSWTVKINGVTYNKGTNPSGAISHCFNGNGSYLFVYSDGIDYRSEIIVVMECSAVPDYGMINLSADVCCVSFEVANTCPALDWVVFFGDGNKLTRPQNGNSDVVAYCYNGPDEYEIEVFYSDQGYASEIVNITCEEECMISHLCWENFIGYYDCAEAILVWVPGENEPRIIKFDWGIYIAGSGNSIAVMMQKVLREWVDPTAEVVLELGAYGCNKGGVSETPSFIVNSEVEVLGILGGDCSGEYGETPNEHFAPFKHCED